MLCTIIQKITKANTRYYLGNDETPPVRRGTSRKHITKIMVLVVVAKPRYDYHRKTMWDGKIGIFEFGKICKAVNDSSNRKKGTRVWKAENVTAKLEIVALSTLDLERVTVLMSLELMLSSSSKSKSSDLEWTASSEVDLISWALKKSSLQFTEYY